MILAAYLTLCVIAGVYVADGTLHPIRRSLSENQINEFRSEIQTLNSDINDAAIMTSDGIVLRAWSIHPRHANGDAVLLFHGLADNRMGMTGYAQIFVAHGFTVLLPGARAHDVSGGELATYGLLERNDIRQWIDYLRETSHPRCIFGFGESMGAAQLLQSLQSGADFCAVVAESSFSSFREIAYDRMGQPFHVGPWLGRTLLRPLVEAAFLRALWKYRLNMAAISPEDAVAGSRVPVLLIHGEIDSNIPVRHSRRIHVHAPHTVLWEVPGADHCGAIAAAPQEFENRVLAWFQAGSRPSSLLSPTV